MKSHFWVFLALTLATSGLTSAQADTMVQPIGVSTNMGAFAFTNINNVINQSGLSTSYTSLSTDISTYAATHDSSSLPNVWLSASGTATGNVDFDLGGTYQISSFALWNTGPTQSTRVRGFNLLASLDNSFATTTSLGSFTTSTLGTTSAVRKELFTFSATPTAFIRMQITSNGGASSTIFGEAAFGVAPAAPPASGVPEPSTMALVAVAGIACLGFLRRRRQQPNS